METVMLKRKRSLAITAALILTALALAGRIGLAQQGTQCKSCTVALANNGNLVVTYDITGLGGTSEAGFTLTATLEGHARCKNQGGNCPEAANKFGPTAVGTQGVLGVHNGRAKGTVTLPLETTLDCPGNQNPIIIDATWTNIVFTVEGQVLLNDPGPISFSAGTCPA
jgi:hypothetical protein